MCYCLDTVAITVDCTLGLNARINLHQAPLLSHISYAWLALRDLIRHGINKMIFLWLRVSARNSLYLAGFSCSRTA